ncbi:MAG: HAMP domain-containing histidine kinase [Actinobacteria bacterium]|nr:MAG: HAMP domain-containing histidine kinase [Actinomycetota bacterium]
MLERISIRWRLALISAGLTCVILCAFAIGVGEATISRIRSDFRNQLVAASDDLKNRLEIDVNTSSGHVTRIRPPLDAYAGAEHAVIRILNDNNGQILGATKDAPNLGRTISFVDRTEFIQGYRVVTRHTNLRSSDPRVSVPVVIQYARKISDLENTVTRVHLFLFFGVIGGTLLALIGGLWLAGRAMRPIAGLTQTARRIAETSDPELRVPQPRADDEVAELARTLDDMLHSLAASRAETETALKRQRQFVADASHELRTPLTSILANLELLADVLEGDQGEAARSALRSSQRMRRLVADLLLLARADAKRELPHEPTDLGRVVVEAAAELGPVSDGHELDVDAERAIVAGAPDELHRLALNLMENAIKHTPPGTHVRAAVERQNGHVVFTVADDGPGIPADLRDRIFERFTRGDGDTGGSFGLGLSIVRAVAESHHGNVALASGDGGARFVVTLPGVPASEPDGSVIGALAPSRNP